MEGAVFSTVQRAHKTWSLLKYQVRRRMFELRAFRVNMAPPFDCAMPGRSVSGRLSLTSRLRFREARGKKAESFLRRAYSEPMSGCEQLGGSFGSVCFIIIHDFIALLL